MDGTDSQGSALVESCHRCGARAVATATQTVVGDRLAWTLSVGCPGCGDAVEACGFDEPPEHVRAAVVSDEGLARLRADPHTGRPPRVAVLAVFRRSGMTLGEAVGAYKRLIGEGISGTPAETRLLADRLAATGATLIVDVPARSVPPSQRAEDTDQQT